MTPYLSYPAFLQHEAGNIVFPRLHSSKILFRSDGLCFPVARFLSLPFRRSQPLIQILFGRFPERVKLITHGRTPPRGQPSLTLPHCPSLPRYALLQQPVLEGRSWTGQGERQLALSLVLTKASSRLPSYCHRPCALEYAQYHGRSFGDIPLKASVCSRIEQIGLYGNCCVEVKHSHADRNRLAVESSASHRPSQTDTPRLQRWYCRISKHPLLFFRRLVLMRIDGAYAVTVE